MLLTKTVKKVALAVTCSLSLNFIYCLSGLISRACCRHSVSETQPPSRLNPQRPHKSRLRTTPPWSKSRNLWRSCGRVKLRRVEIRGGSRSWRSSWRRWSNKTKRSRTRWFSCTIATMTWRACTTSLVPSRKLGECAEGSCVESVHGWVLGEGKCVADVFGTSTGAAMMWRRTMIPVFWRTWWRLLLRSLGVRSLWTCRWGPS